MTAERARGQGASAEGPSKGAEDEVARGEGAIAVDSQAGSGDNEVGRVYTQPTDTCEDEERQSTTNNETHQNGASAQSASHDNSLTTTNEANEARAPAAVNETARAAVTRPPHTPVEHHELPDDADEVERAGKERVEASESRTPAASRGLGEVVEVAGDHADESRRSEGQDEVEDTACVEARPPEGVQFFWRSIPAISHETRASCLSLSAETQGQAARLVERPQALSLRGRRPRHVESRRMRGSERLVTAADEYDQRTMTMYLKCGLHLPNHLTGH